MDDLSRDVNKKDKPKIAFIGKPPLSMINTASKLSATMDYLYTENKKLEQQNKELRELVEHWISILEMADHTRWSMKIKEELKEIGGE